MVRSTAQKVKLAPTSFVNQLINSDRKQRVSYAVLRSNESTQRSVLSPRASPKRSPKMSKHKSQEELIGTATAHHTRAKTVVELNTPISNLMMRFKHPRSVTKFAQDSMSLKPSNVHTPSNAFDNSGLRTPVGENYDYNHNTLQPETLENDVSVACMAIRCHSYTNFSADFAIICKYLELKPQKSDSIHSNQR